MKPSIGARKCFEKRPLALVDFSVLDSSLNDSYRLDVCRIAQLLKRLDVAIVVLPALPVGNVFTTRQLCCVSDWDVVLDSKVILDPPWLSNKLWEEANRAEVGHELIVVGAIPDDVPAINRIRAKGTHVTVVNWPNAFDLELVWAANHSLKLDESYKRHLPAINANLLAQAA